MTRRAKKVAKLCDDCLQPVPAKFRVLTGQYTCDGCYARVMNEDPDPDVDEDDGDDLDEEPIRRW